MPLHDASQFAPAFTGTIGPERGAEWSPRLHWRAATPLADALNRPTAPPEFAVPVIANENRWVVACPDCNGAQFACRTDRRFMCVECANFATNGLWRPVTWPGDAAKIEAELDKRPDMKTRNWVPGETVADLVAELASARVTGRA